MSDYDKLRTCFIEALAETQGLDPAEVAVYLTSLGDDYMFELDSKAAEFLLVAAEVVAGRQMPCPADLGRSQYATLGVLLDAAMKEMQ